MTFKIKNTIAYISVPPPKKNEVPWHKLNKINYKIDMRETIKLG